MDAREAEALRDAAEFLDQTRKELEEGSPWWECLGVASYEMHQSAEENSDESPRPPHLEVVR